MFISKNRGFRLRISWSTRRRINNWRLNKWRASKGRWRSRKWRRVLRRWELIVWRNIFNRRWKGRSKSRRRRWPRYSTSVSNQIPRFSKSYELFNNFVLVHWNLFFNLSHQCFKWKWILFVNRRSIILRRILIKLIKR